MEDEEKMKVLIIGATGTVGSALRQTLLNETDAELTLFSRHISQGTTTRETALAGDVYSMSDLSKAIKGQDVIFVALSGDLEKMAKNIVRAMNEESVSRLIFIASMGIYNEIPASVGAGGNLENNSMLTPYRKAADVIESSNLNYTIIRPGWFDNGSQEYEVTHKGEPFGGHNIAVASIADLAKRLIEDDSFGSRDSLGIHRPE